MVKWSEAELLALDKRFGIEGVSPHARPFRAAMEILKLTTGFSFRNNMETIRAISADYSKIVPGQPTYSPGLGIGLVASGDAVHLVRVPIVFGQISLQVFQILGFQDKEEWYNWCRRDDEIVWNSIHTSADIWDIAHSIEKVSSSSPEFVFWNNAREQIFAFAAILNSNVDTQSAVQPICIAAELSVKAALVQCGFTENRLKSEVGHNIANGVTKLNSISAQPEDAELLRIAKAFPKYENTRYEIASLSRLELVKLGIAAQFICASSFRRFGYSNLASKFQTYEAYRPRKDLLSFT